MTHRRLKIVIFVAGLLFFYGIPGHAFLYEDLVDLIRNKFISTIDQVLPHLPAEFLENYTLAYDSRSLHESSPDFPRVILFGNSAKLILTFNGSPDQRGYQNLEIMQFREEARVFELRSISFDKGIRFSDRNPAACLACHGASPRPVWSSYEYSEDNEVQHWPGFYGSTHDAPILNPEEKAAFVRFLTLAPAHPRYQSLKLQDEGSRWYPYGPGPYKHQFRPNNRLGNLLARLNAQRVAHHLRQSPIFRAYPNLSLLWILHCPQISKEAYAHFLAERNLRSYALQSKPGSNLPRSGERTGFVLEKLLSGMDTWNLTLESGADESLFFTGIVRIDELVAAALLSSLPANHWLRQYYVPWTQRELYDTFQAGYYAANVAPGGVGAAYEALGRFYDRDRARKACPDLDKLASAEVIKAGS